MNGMNAEADTDEENGNSLKQRDSAITSLTEQAEKRGVDIPVHLPMFS